MRDLSPDRATVRPWIVCQSNNRWLPAARRFAPELMPAPLVADVIAADGAGAYRMFPADDRLIILWEVQRHNFTSACDWLAQTAAQRPAALSLAATTGLSAADLLVLSEFRVAATLRHPEQLPSLLTMVRAYFADGK